MGTYDLIDSYLARLSRATGWHPESSAVVDEMADHLLTSVEVMETRGVEPTEAQHLALARFGSPADVAWSLSLGPQRRPAIPTRSTVTGSAIVFVGAGAWVLYAVATFVLIHLYERLGDADSSPDSSTPLQVLVMMPWALGAAGGMGLLFVTGLILKERHGGFHWTGWAGLGVLAIGIPLSFIGWFIPGWGTFLTIGAALLAAELLRDGLTPRLPAIGLAIGPALGFVVWGGLRAIEVGSPDEFGNYPIPSMAGVVVACAILAAALVGLGRWLQGETPIDFEASHPVPAPA
jgi:hypothetical protein